MIVLLALAVHLRTIRFGFVFDDYPLIAQNAFIQEPWSALRAFAHYFWYGSRFGGYYRPLITASLALNGKILGWGPSGFHLFNVYIHALNALLLFVVARRLRAPAWAAGVAAALFAVHPVAAWPVASIVARVDLLPATFILLAWWALSTPSAGGWTTALTGLFFLGALLCKESALAFLVVPFLLVRRTAPRTTPEEADEAPLQRRVSVAVAAVAAILVYLTLRHWAGVPLMIERENIDPFINPLARVAWPGRLYAALELSGRYISYLVAPTRFSDPNGYGPGTSPPAATDMWVVLSALLLAAWSLGILVVWLRRSRLAAPLAFALGAFLPSSNLIAPIGSLYAQNFLYLPLLGLCLALAIELGRIPAVFSARPLDRRPIPRAVVVSALVVLVPVLAAASFREEGIWHDEVSLFTAWTDRFPKYALAHHRLGMSLLDEGRPKEAAAAFKTTLGLDDRNPETHDRLAMALVSVPGAPAADLQQALEQNRMATSLLSADLADVRARGAQILLLLDRPQDAETEAREGLRLVPGFPPARQNLAEALFRQSRWSEAAAEFKDLSRLSPQDPDTRSPYVVALIHSGNLAEARTEIESARKDFPALPWFDFCLARVEALSGRKEEAIALLKRSFERDRATREWIGKVEEFKSYRGTPGFDSLLEESDTHP